jgi:hypothetical protein
MVMLSTLAVSKEFEGAQMLTSILQMGFFLILATLGTSLHVTSDFLNPFFFPV